MRRPKAAVRERRADPAFVWEKENAAVTSVEASGRSLDEAKHAALESLGAEEPSVEFEVLEDGTRNFLSLGSGLVRVRATLKLAPRARRKSAGPGPATKARAKDPPAVEPDPTAKAPAAPSPREAEAPAKAPRKPAARTDAPPRAGDVVDPNGADLPESGPFCHQLLQQALDAMDLDLRADLKMDRPEEVRIEIAGPDVAVLLARQGHQTPFLNALEALQYILGMIAHRKCQGRPRLVLDAQNYRASREEALQRMARQVADHVRATGQEAVTEALNPAERRIIHTALADDANVTTYSEGADPDRRVVISPRD